MFINYQVEKPRQNRKVSIIGAAGLVGSALGYDLMLTNFCDEVVFVDIPTAKDKLMGCALDVCHAASIHKGPKIYASTDIQDTRDSDVIVLTCGAPVGPNQTRLDVIKINTIVFKSVVIPAAKFSPNCVFVIVTNPCDVLSWVCWKYSGFSMNKCIGTGTILESARFRYFIGQRLGIHPSSVDAHFIGEHGASTVPLWSSLSIAGTRLREIDPCIAASNDKYNWKDAHTNVMNSPMFVRDHKQCTNWAITLVTEQVCRAILTNSDEIFPCSTCIKGFYGIETECFISYPVQIGNKGIKKIINIQLSCDEITQLQKSAEILDKVLKTVQL